MKEIDFIADAAKIAIGSYKPNALQLKQLLLISKLFLGENGVKWVSQPNLQIPGMTHTKSGLIYYHNHLYCTNHKLKLKNNLNYNGQYKHKQILTQKTAYTNTTCL